MTATEQHLQPGTLLTVHHHDGDPLTGCVVEAGGLGVLLYCGTSAGKGREMSLVPWSAIRRLQSTGARTLAAAKEMGPELDRLLELSERERRASP